MHCLWRLDTSLSGIGWYAKVNELMIISEDQDLISKQTRLVMETATIFLVDCISLYIIYL